MRRYIAMDLFCGCGGLTLGLELAGFSVIGAVDVDPLAVETYRANHPEVLVWEMDIRRLGVTEVMERLKLNPGDLDLLAGCPPCQGFSSIRTLNGAKVVDDERNDLVFDFLRFVEGLLPKTVMMENVPALATDSRMEIVRRALHELGYSEETRILDAADFGVPQRRRRMILLAGRFGPIEFPATTKEKASVRDYIWNLPRPGASGDPLHDLPEKRSLRVLELIRKIPKDGGSRTDLSLEEQLACHRNCSGFKDVYGRMRWDAVAPTITGGCTNPSKGRFLHPDQDRAITLREAALLQTFPPDYWFSLRRGKYAAAIMIGNALPPKFIQHHALRIRDYIDQQGVSLWA